MGENGPKEAVCIHTTTARRRRRLCLGREEREKGERERESVLIRPAAATADLERSFKLGETAEPRLHGMSEDEG